MTGALGGEQDSPPAEDQPRRFVTNRSRIRRTRIRTVHSRR